VSPPPARPAYGVLGGTFDPVHVGHLHAACCVRDAFGLEAVLLVPSHVPPHKLRPDMAAPGQRLEMARIAAEPEAGLRVASLELDRGGVSYTIDTLRQLARERPAADPLFVLGTDAFLDLRTWKEPEALVREFDLVVVDRPGSALGPGEPDPGLAARLVTVPSVPGAGVPMRAAPRPEEGRIFRLEIPRVEVSSSGVRARAARGQDLDGLVPPGVGRYIRDQGLYLQEGRT
jgi:nicotinate-nucleotide adenylyltransferase